MSKALVCLHGWGGTKESFTELRAALAGTDITILTPDLPGFGSEPEPNRPWNTDDYADWIINWLHTNHQSLITNTDWYLLGHSHGGRIAIKLLTNKLSTLNSPAFAKASAGRQLSTPSHLFPCAAAGIRHPRHVKRIIGLTLAKTGKFFLNVPGFKALEPLGKKFLYKLVRVHGYENASPIMRETLIKVSAEDVRPLLPKIAIPTDLFWGIDDRMTPLSDGTFMEKSIPGAVLHTYPGVRHRVHRDRANEIAAVIKERMLAPAH